MKIIITGAAGFVGFHLCQKLLENGHVVIGIDNLNDYYDIKLKHDRLKQIENKSDFSFHKMDIADNDNLQELFRNHGVQQVVHLAAQAGVRYSIDNPHAYTNSNLVGFVNILEACRNTGIDHLIFASSSSVYGANKKLPYSVNDRVDHPVSLYGATKKANELIAHSYSYLYGIPITGLRFFTVYGPWGRPDMSYYKFTKNIFEGMPIDIYNQGKHRRDFTYIDDIIAGIVSIVEKTITENQHWNDIEQDPGSGSVPYRIFNLGNNNPEELMTFVQYLENIIGRKAEKNFLPMQPGDMEETSADIKESTREFGFHPAIPLEEGLKHFVSWYKAYHHVSL